MVESAERQSFDPETLPPEILDELHGLIEDLDMGAASERTPSSRSTTLAARKARRRARTMQLVRSRDGDDRRAGPADDQLLEGDFPSWLDSGSSHVSETPPSLAPAVRPGAPERPPEASQGARALSSIATVEPVQSGPFVVDVDDEEHVRSHHLDEGLFLPDLADDVVPVQQKPVKPYQQSAAWSPSVRTRFELWLRNSWTLIPLALVLAVAAALFVAFLLPQ